MSKGVAYGRKFDAISGRTDKERATSLSHWLLPWLQALDRDMLDKLLLLESLVVNSVLPDKTPVFEVLVQWGNKQTSKEALIEKINFVFKNAYEKYGVELCKPTEEPPASAITGGQLLTFLQELILQSRSKFFPSTLMRLYNNNTVVIDRESIDAHVRDAAAGKDFNALSSLLFQVTASDGGAKASVVFDTLVELYRSPELESSERGEAFDISSHIIKHNLQVIEEDQVNVKRAMMTLYWKMIATYSETGLFTRFPTLIGQAIFMRGRPIPAPLDEIVVQI